ncbi:MAG: hypothetical protein QM714_12270 [Nocardioides sp.]|uniref:hypothetical protein n=1 Tax=Nocardioides sp. TaxID=35761 RepID=UPI0039E4D911
MTDGAAPEAEHEPTRSGRWRPIAASVLVAMAVIIAPLSVVSRWAHDLVSDSDRYVETVAPLASDPAMQDAVIERLSAEITTRLRVESIADRAVDALTDRGMSQLRADSLRMLAAPLAESIENLVEDQVSALVRSEEFQDAWREANHEAHVQLVAMLTGKDTDTVEVTGTSVSVNLATVVDAVKQQLIDRGFQIAERLPEVQAEFTIVESTQITRFQRAFRVLDRLSLWLPIAGIVCLLGGIWVSRSRRRTLVIGSLGVAASMLVLGVALNVLRGMYLDALPAAQLHPEAAAAAYDIVTRFLRVSLRALLTLGLAVAFIAWLGGPGAAPAGLRRGTARAIGAARSGGGSVGLDTGRFGVVLDTYRTPIRVVVLAAALLAYVLRDHPTARYTLWLALLVAIILLLVELLSHPAPAADASRSGPAEPPTPA